MSSNLFVFVREIKKIYVYKIKIPFTFIATATQKKKITDHVAPASSTRLEEEESGLPCLLLGRLGRTVRLVIGMSGSESRMIFQVTIDSEYSRKRSKIHVKPSGVEYLWNETAVGERYVVADAILSSAGG